MRSSPVKRSAFIKKEKLLSVCVCLNSTGTKWDTVIKAYKYDSGGEITKHWVKKYTNYIIKVH